VLLTTGSVLAPLLIGWLARAAARAADQLGQGFTGFVLGPVSPALFTGVTLVLICAARRNVLVPEDHRRHARAVAAGPPRGVHRRRQIIGFVIWTHVTASTAFFLNVIELLAILALLAAVWLIYDHHEASPSPRHKSPSRPASSHLHRPVPERDGLSTNRRTTSPCTTASGGTRSR
jgi:hypothetical protein